MNEAIRNCAGEPGLEALAIELAEMSRAFYLRGWMLGTSGSVSARTGADPLSMVVTVSGKDKGALCSADLLHVVDDGKIFNTLGDPKASSESFYEGRPRPSGETLVHEAIYRRFESAGAVTHVHTVDNTLCSELAARGELVFEGLEMLKGIGCWRGDEQVRVPVVENALEIPRLGELVFEAADAAVPGVLVRGHGIYVWGPDITRAKRHTEIFEFLFSHAIKARMVGL